MDIDNKRLNQLIEEEKDRFRKKIQVREELLPATFFYYYRKLAKLMEADGSIDESLWTFHTGIDAFIIAKAVHDEDLKLMIKEMGYKRFIAEILNETYRDKEEDVFDLRKKVNIYVDSLIGLMGGEAIYSPCFVFWQDKILAIPYFEYIGKPSIAHEVGHVLYEEKGAHLRENHKLESEMFASFAQDFILREEGTSFAYYYNTFPPVVLSEDYEIIFNLYLAICEFYENDFEKLTNHFKEVFWGKRKHSELT